MNTSSNDTLYHAQHKNRCYCQNRNLCYCMEIENPAKSSGSSNKFVKIRKNHDKSTSFCSTNSFSPAPTFMTSISTSSRLTGSSSSSEPKHTGRRELYEQSKGGEPSELFCDDKIAKLQEFRLQNADECLSSCSRYSVEKMRSGISNEAVKETRYAISKRGLLKSIDDSDDNKAAIVDSKSAVKDILRQKLNSSKDKSKFMKKALCLPENSLALRYQKTY